MVIKKDMKIFLVGVGSIGRRHSDVLYSDLECKNITLWDPVRAVAEAHAAKYPEMKVVDTFEQGLAETIEWFTKQENLAKYKANIYNR